MDWVATGVVISGVAVTGTALYGLFRAGSFVQKIVDKLDGLKKSFDDFVKKDLKNHENTDRLLRIYDERLDALEQFKAKTEQQLEMEIG